MGLTKLIELLAPGILFGGSTGGRLGRKHLQTMSKGLFQILYDTSGDRLRHLLSEPSVRETTAIFSPRHKSHFHQR